MAELIVRKLARELYDKILAAEKERDNMRAEMNQAMAPYDRAANQARAAALEAVGLKMHTDGQGNFYAPGNVQFVKDDRTGECYVVEKPHWM